MINQFDEDMDPGLILAAEECPPEDFSKFHKFSAHDELIIRKLMAHGPVLIRGGRGSGKSALLIEAQLRMRKAGNVLPVYVSLRHLPLLQSEGEEYITHFCKNLSRSIRDELSEEKVRFSFPIVGDQTTLQENLLQVSQDLNRRIVLLFDDAAHIGREKPLEGFFDLFRTISSSLVSCKASIYPGVTRFGTRFDVYNDSTVLEVSRSDVSKESGFFLDVLQARYSPLAAADRFSGGLSPAKFASIIGRAVVGNMRGFILACNRFDNTAKIGIPELNTCILEMATDYYWPLMDEVAPKLGVYEPLIDPARAMMESIVDHAVKLRDRRAAQDRVLIHRQFIAHYAKIFEILEYLGFLSRREASRAMKSGGRGSVFAINLCNLLEMIPGQRLTAEGLEEWISGAIELAEIHVSGNLFAGIEMPTIEDDDRALSILEKGISNLSKSPAYPYGLTADKISRLRDAGYETVGQLAEASDYNLRQIPMVGPVTLQRVRDVVRQAIWM